MAEGGGFEPPGPVKARWFSRPVQSSALPSLRKRGYGVAHRETSLVGGDLGAALMPVAGRNDGGVGAIDELPGREGVGRIAGGGSTQDTGKIRSGITHLGSIGTSTVIFKPKDW